MSAVETRDQPLPRTLQAAGGGHASEPAFIARIRARARRRVLWLRHLWSSGLMGMEQGMAIPHTEVDRLLLPAEELTEREACFYATDEAARHAALEVREADRRALEDGVLERMGRKLGLTAPEQDLLGLAAAAEIDPLLRRVYGYLHDDAALCSPTPWLAAMLFEWRSPFSFGPESGLVRWRAAGPVEGWNSPWSPATPWRADPHLLPYLLPGEAPLAADSAFIPTGEAGRLPCLYPAERQEAWAFVEALTGGEQPTVDIVLLGPDGAGKKTLVGQLCAELGRDLLVADARGVAAAEPKEAVEQAIRVARTACLSGAALYWDGAERVAPAVWRALPNVGLRLFGTTAPLELPERPHTPRHEVRLPRLTQAMRKELWAQLSDQPAPAPVADWPLAPGAIASAARVAPAGPEAVREACRGATRRGMSHFCAPLPCPYTWEDLVLPEPVRTHVEELEAQVRLRWPVYEEWGLERLCPMGRGITALFAGPSGTGKTMTAQVLARSLELELYRIDLAGVMSKYIGETEKNLKQIFDSCEQANVLLFFDEADAIFGRRTEIKDAHDRYANIETDYLLQRMEQFDGLAVLATNRKGEIDPAFLRRLRFLVDFTEPGPAERAALWRLALPERTPADEPLLDAIDWEVLAARLSMTGAEIKGAALAAAFLARAEGSRIGMRHLLHAARREMTRQGKVVRAGSLD